MSTPTDQNLVVGLDIGGTRIKCGIYNVATHEVLSSDVAPTPREEAAFFATISDLVSKQAAQVGQPHAVGVSIGSYVFADGSIDGMSSFVPFLTHGYPLGAKISECLKLPARVDNDARLIALAEAVSGVGAPYHRVLVLTLGTGIGVGLVEDKRPVGADSSMHLAGHILVRAGNEFACLDSEPCYCGQTGCFESTCSGTSLAKLVHDKLEENATNEVLFQRAQAGDKQAQEIVQWYISMLCRALNSYVYIYCPDAIVLAGGVAHALGPWIEHIQKALVAEVYEGQHTDVLLTTLKEDSGIIGAASLFAS